MPASLSETRETPGGRKTSQPTRCSTDRPHPAAHPFACKVLLCLRLEVVAANNRPSKLGVTGQWSVGVAMHQSTGCVMHGMCLRSTGCCTLLLMDQPKGDDGWMDAGWKDGWGCTDGFRQAQRSLAWVTTVTCALQGWPATKGRTSVRSERKPFCYFKQQHDKI